LLLQLGWALIKPTLNDVTLAKIRLLGADYQQALLEVIPAENLPTFLGGKCQCPGGCVRRVDPDEGFTKLAVSAASTPLPFTPSLLLVLDSGSCV
jgi:hypothetical protein